jgi:uncharacterized small protein (DUF1192 family)
MCRLFRRMLVLNLAESSAIADELGALEAELEPLKAKIARVEALRKAVRALFRDSDPTAEHRIAGEQYSVLVGAATLETHVLKADLVALIGAARYATFAQATLDAIEKHCGGAILAAVTKKQRTGPRAVKSFALPRPAPAAVSAKTPGKKVSAVAEAAPPAKRKRVA